MLQWPCFSNWQTSHLIQRDRLGDVMVDSDLERQLVAKATAGDRVALHQLLLMYGRPLAKHIAPKIPRSVQGVISAEDITQQTFAYVFRHIEEFVPQSDGAFSAWLKQIAECRTQDAIKTLKRDKRGGNRRQVHKLTGAQASSMADLVDMLSAGSHTPSRSAARHEAVAAVQQAIDHLPEDYRQAVQLRLLEGRTLEEVASVSGTADVRQPGCQSPAASR